MAVVPSAHQAATEVGTYRQQLDPSIVAELFNRNHAVRATLSNILELPAGNRLSLQAHAHMYADVLDGSRHVAHGRVCSSALWRYPAVSEHS